MSTLFETYSPRKIEFRETKQIEDWHVKLYTITKNEEYTSGTSQKALLEALPDLLQAAGQSSLPTYKTAFLIVHEAREGVLILLNWWTGENMVETQIFFSNYNTPNKIEASPFKGKALVCIWELEIFAHERKAWIEHVLSKPDAPDFQEYQKDVLI